LQKLFLTFFYSGLLPKMPGTWGSILAAIFGYFIITNLGVQTLFLLTILISIVSIDVINRYEKEVGVHDSSEIVIDEVAGVWLAFCISGATTLQLVLSLVFFRIFDIWKPSVIGRIDRDVSGGLGVMGDDLLAGVFAGIASGMGYMLWSDYLSGMF